MNCEEMCYIVETAPSFEQISQSITGLLTDSAADASEDAETCDDVFSTATLSAEYQQISTWCWVNIRVCYLHFYTVSCLAKMWMRVVWWGFIGSVVYINIRLLL